MACDAIEGLGIDYEAPEGAFVVGGCVMLKVLGADGVVQLISRWSDGIPWTERVGMLVAAKRFEMSWIGEDDDD